MFIPILVKVFLGIGPDCDHGCVPLDESIIILAQLRHVPAAVGSEETAVEHQIDILLPFKVGKRDRFTLCVFEGEIPNLLPNLYSSFTHG
jgi:hypothetical protein